MEKVNRHVNDLGMAAYILMLGYDIVCKKVKSYYFALNREEVDSFPWLTIEYLNERKYHLYDHCIMSLKKVPDIEPRIENVKSVSDLGLAAYIFMNDFDIAGRTGSNFYFEIANQERSVKFDKLTMEYLSSPFHRFDHCIMSLKKVPESR